MHSNGQLYEEDFYAWTQATARLIRQGHWTVEQILSPDFWPDA